MSDAVAARPGNLGLYDLQGKIAVISGGSSGIGAATARRLAEADDVAVAIMGAVVYLRQTTGTTILVDAGKHL